MNIRKHGVGLSAVFVIENDFPHIVVVTRETQVSKIMSLGYNCMVETHAQKQELLLATNCQCLINVKLFYMTVFEATLPELQSQLHYLLAV